MSRQAQIINLLLDFMRDMGIAFSGLSLHDMAVVERDQPSRGGDVHGANRGDRSAKGSV